MRYGIGQVPEGALPRSASEAIMPTVAPTTKEIPYDYVARFVLTGRNGTRVQDVINISIEGAFVAAAIGYSFIPGKLEEKIATSVLGKVFNSGELESGKPFVGSLLAKLCGIDFKYSIVDSGTGRELQNQPIHNIAGLGKADGERPFRPLAKPMIFMPRSTIRIEVEEVSTGSLYDKAELYIVLHGYKILNYGTALP